MDIVPFPPHFTRNVDFIPSCRLQEALAPDQEICYATALTSASRSRTGALRSVDSIRIRPIRQTIQGLLVDVGDPNPDPDPRKVERISLRELQGALLDVGFEDATLKQRILLHEIPRGLDAYPEFQGYDALYELQRASSHNPHQMRRQLGIRLWNFRPVMTGELLKLGLVRDRRDSALKRLRSALVTEGVKPADPHLGWSHFESRHDLLMATLAQDMPRRARFWLDTGRPRPVNVTFDGFTTGVRLFQLLKNREMIALSAPETL